MGASQHVVGFRPPDDKWLKMKAIWDACTAAGMPIPREVEKFFGDSDPDPQGVEVPLRNTPCCAEYSADMQDGFEIDVRKLPEDVTIIRCYTSY